MKKIVLNGFKSFYTRTEVDFSDDITCVVGPNGCGKSNILDAVRWVLGEQSAKQLRGEEISDVISAGNARRAQKNKAEAYLTFADVQGHLETERDEVEVGRIVNRDGKGTYLLNGDEVRLKDVQDLFRDTGIGQDLYSIIGQGEVVKLIKSKPEERREIIEEAAGISTFRHRRDLTRRRLKQTREELEVVDKELREKRGRLSQLKGQAEQAEKVHSYQRQLRECKIEQSRREFLRHTKSLEDLDKSIEKARSRHKKLIEKKESAQSSLDESETDLRRIQQRIQTFQDRRTPLKEQRQQLREEASRLQTRRDSISGQIDRDRNNIKQQRRQQTRLSREIEELYRSRYDNRLQKQIADQTVDVLESRERQLKRESQTLRDQLEGIRSRSLFEISEESELKHRLQAAREEREEIRESRRELEEYLASTRTRAQEAEQTVQTHFQQLVEDESEWVRLRLENERHQTELDALSRLSDELRHSLIDIRQRRDRLTNRRDSLEQFMDDYEGFYPGVRKLMNRAERESAPGWSDAVHGVLANLISVVPAYEDAVEAVLEQEIQAVVVDRRADALEMIQFLRDKESGRARFFTLDKTGASEATGNGKPPHPEAVSALDVVEAPSMVEPLLKDLLVDVWIVEDLERALALHDRENGRAGQQTWVTRGGEILDGNHSISGGKRQEGRSNLLHRGEELEQLQEDVAEVERQENDLETSINRLDSILEQVQSRCDQIGNALQGIRLEHRENRRQLEKDRSNWREARNQFENGALQLTELIGRSCRVSYEMEGLQVVQSEVSGRESERRKVTREIRSQLASLEDQLESQQLLIRQSLRKCEESSARVRELSNRIEEVLDRRRQSRESIDSLVSEMDRLRDEWFEREQNRVRTSLAEQRLNLQVNVYRAIENSWNEKQSSHQENLRSLNRTLQEQERKTEKARSQLERLEREQENEQARLQQLKQEFQEEYDRELSEDSLPDAQREDLGDDELGKEIRRLQSEIRSMQPVNMLAKKELDGLEDEVESVADQKDDLEASCDKLDRMIRRLNYRARTQFQEAFEEIQGYFEDFVQELFNGGEGRLELTDDPVLDSGVTLEIQPPGEKLKSMSALSGGEKTLTALAFLFALFERKATPFAFLDEVDAPFDDENVAQFINLINRYSDRTQFVIITHNKATMQAASQLYGVTMEESGVSSLVSVELEEAESLREQPRMATS